MTDETEKISPIDNLFKYLDKWIVSSNSNQSNSRILEELEIIFGIDKFNKISKTSFDNVINKLTANNWMMENEKGTHYLNINQRTENLQGRTTTSPLRFQVNGISAVSEYCKTETIVDSGGNLKENIYITKKVRKLENDSTSYNQDTKRQDRAPPLSPIFIDNYQCKVNYKVETNFIDETQKEFEDDRSEKWVKREMEKWEDTTKIFRYIKRYTLVNDEYPFKIDCSVVKEPKVRKVGNRLIWVPHYHIKDSGIFENNAHYEIELELNWKYIENLIKEVKSKHPKYYVASETFGTSRWGEFQGEETNSNKFLIDALYKKIKSGIKVVLSGLQNTNYPISYPEQNNVTKKYIELTFSDETSKKGKGRKITKQQLLQDTMAYKRQSKKYFIGPATVSLERKHLSKKPIDDMPNINNLYTITEKADGVRRMLYISDNGKIYFLDINLTVTFIGCITKNKKLFNTILDGEYVSYDNSRRFINLYLLFDIYYLGGEDLKGLDFYNIKSGSNGCRFDKLNAVYSNLINDKKMENIVKGKSLPINIRLKNFMDNRNANIYSQCQQLLEKINNNHFEYEVDGIIFTPIDKKIVSGTWMHSFKWKPPRHNTIDFLIQTEKEQDEKNDSIYNKFIEGTNSTSSNELQQYKKVTLRVGFSQRNHGFLNPIQTMITGDMPKKTYNYQNYYPVPFYPYNNNESKTSEWHIANIPLKKVGSKLLMVAEDGNIFDDETIVEFKYEKDSTVPSSWKWKPIKVRFDKTFAYRKGQPNFGNDYKTANSVWKSIHNPVTEEMLSGKIEIPENIEDADVYYSKHDSVTKTQAFRNFHNRYVKHNLIKRISTPGDSLIDLAVGKAGDMPKWIDSRLSTVVGIDYSRDNIENQVDGAASRYLKQKQQGRKLIPDCMFLKGDSSKNIKSGEAFSDDKNKAIMKAIYGLGTKDKKEIGKGLYDVHGIGRDGFNIVSVQFAAHYFFEDLIKLNEFVKNVAENCAVKGYFIGTCFDGKKLFNKLKDLKENETFYQENKNKEVIWSATKLYSKETFDADETSLGLPVEIFQESINKKHTEFLVNFKYFERILNNYGFTVCNSQELNSIHFKNSVGSFQELFDDMKQEIEREDGGIKETWVGDALKLSDAEKNISFLNNYFIFKKRENTIVNVEISTNQTVQDKITKEQEDLYKDISKQMKKTKRKVTKFKKKFKLPS
jgi:hypothetical protein|uniref:mRNA (guanine-N(7))-methyltransferase n=1 Tax=viral metagenome TaxID=1070528 RepID=A0A6C0ITL6_9ZZZZ